MHLLNRLRAPVFIQKIHLQTSIHSLMYRVLAELWRYVRIDVDGTCSPLRGWRPAWPAISSRSSSPALDQFWHGESISFSNQEGSPELSNMEVARCPLAS